MTSLRWSTPVEVPSPRVRLGLADSLVTMGSCFADELGRRLSAQTLPVTDNPFGVLYNPESLAQALERGLDPRPVEADELWRSEDRVYHPVFGSSSARTDLAAALELARAGHRALASGLARARALVVTFGTAEVWRDRASGRVVGNCQQRPARDFERSMLEVEAIVFRWTELMERLRACLPGLGLIISVSPVRYLKSGAVAHQRSKARLVLAAESLVASLADCDYFPAYEIVLDELRDYRFYADDLVHPATVAVEHVSEAFVTAHCDAKLRQRLVAAQRLANGLAHRFRVAGGDAARDYVDAQARKLDSFVECHPEADVWAMRGAFEALVERSRGASG